MADSKLKVGISTFPPFVVSAGQHPTGFEIELWEMIAAELKLNFEYETKPFQTLLPSLQEKAIDIAIAGLTLTEEREKVIDFSHSTFDSGLHILVSNRSRMSIFSILKSLFTKEFRNIFLLLLVFIFISANLIWLSESGGNGNLSGPYSSAIFNAVWWALTTLSTVGYGDYVPVTVFGRVVAMFIILCGMGVFSLFVGQISSAITLRKLRSDIRGPEDLAGRKAATVQGSVAEQTLLKLGARTVAVSAIEDAYRKLEVGEVDAVVFDAPVLLYYSHHRGNGSTAIVGEQFEKQNYGFAVQEGSVLRESINRTILGLYDSGEYAALYKKWFGEEF